jgi:hypothetical protein
VADCIKPHQPALDGHLDWSMQMFD